MTLHEDLHREVDGRRWCFWCGVDEWEVEPTRCPLNEDTDNIDPDEEEECLATVLIDEWIAHRIAEEAGA